MLGDVLIRIYRSLCPHNLYLDYSSPFFFFFLLYFPFCLCVWSITGGETTQLCGAYLPRVHYIAEIYISSVCVCVCCVNSFLFLPIHRRDTHERRKKKKHKVFGVLLRVSHCEKEKGKDKKSRSPALTQKGPQMSDPDCLLLVLLLVFFFLFWI